MQRSGEGGNVDRLRGAAEQLPRQHDLFHFPALDPSDARLNGCCIVLAGRLLGYRVDRLVGHQPVVTREDRVHRCLGSQRGPLADPRDPRGRARGLPRAHERRHQQLAARGRVEGERAERDDPGSPRTVVALELDSFEDASHPSGRHGVGEAVVQGDRRGLAEGTDDELVARMQRAVTGCGALQLACAVAAEALEENAAGSQAHDRPRFVATTSWLSPPLRRCRLTLENPASHSSSRSAPGVGRYATDRGRYR